MKPGSQNGLPDSRASDLPDDPVIGDLGTVGQGANVLGNSGAHLVPRMVNGAAGLAVGAIPSETSRDTRTPGKERPILFGGPMVRALLEGQKTQTRRPINGKRTRYQTIGERDDGSRWPWSEDEERGGDYWHPSPYGKPGDRLWVREAWSVATVARRDAPCRDTVVYRADFPEDYDMFGIPSRRWYPSIHMKRADCRITLEITGVRVERLQDISADDCVAEGCGAEAFWPESNAVAQYKRLWESINGPGSWEANPWVWVVEFKRVQK